MNVVVSPDAMLKLLQFNTAVWLTVTLSCEPDACAEALPLEKTAALFRALRDEIS